MKTLRILLLFCLLLGGGIAYGQHGRHGHGGRHGHPHKVVVVKRSAYRPAKVVVYHPRWRPAYACQRRWVYFPGRNFYWDNWRNHYVFWNGTIWVSQAAVPPMVVNVNLENEKVVQLQESEDDVDDIYLANNQHQTAYKSE